jgi:RNA polymerase sigma-70 factor (ECF subfamily)
MTGMNDIVRRVRDGDRDAYREVVKEYGASIGGFIAAYLPQRELVDDLTQETFIAAYQHLDQFKTDQELGPWLKGIARNKVITYLRQRYRHGSALERLKAEALERVADEVDRAQSGDDSACVDRLKDCLEKLPPRLRQVVQARYYERRRVNAIARALGSTASAISSLLFRGRKELETCLGRSR